MGVEKGRGKCGGHNCQRATGPCGWAPTAGVLMVTTPILSYDGLRRELD